METAPPPPPSVAEVEVDSTTSLNPQPVAPLLRRRRHKERGRGRFIDKYITVAQEVFGPCLMTSGYFRLYSGIKLYDRQVPFFVTKNVPTVFLHTKKQVAVESDIIWLNCMPKTGLSVFTQDGELQVWYGGLTVPGCHMSIMEQRGGIMLSNVWLLAKQELDRKKLLAEKRANRQTMEMTNPKFSVLLSANGRWDHATDSQSIHFEDNNNYANSPPCRNCCGNFVRMSR